MKGWWRSSLNDLQYKQQKYNGETHVKKVFIASALAPLWVHFRPSGADRVSNLERSGPAAVFNVIGAGISEKHQNKHMDKPRHERKSRVPSVENNHRVTRSQMT